MVLSLDELKKLDLLLQNFFNTANDGCGSTCGCVDECSCDSLACGCEVKIECICDVECRCNTQRIF